MDDKDVKVGWMENWWNVHDSKIMKKVDE